MISGIGWVSELVQAAGGIDVFPDRARCASAKERIVCPQAVIAAAPEIVIGSWCGKKFRPERFSARPGFSALPAVRDGFVREIKSALILQPGPAALTDGFDAIRAVIDEWLATRVRPVS
jgi:iron complex transport system substrate-binding protein